MKDGLWLGLDPGGKRNLALSFLRSNVAEAHRVISIAEALKMVKEEPLGIGIDSPLWWSARATGIRKVDEWIRNEYGISHKTVQAVNSMWGAVLVQGMLFAAEIRKKYPNVPITEAHPKAVWKAFNYRSAADWLLDKSIRFDTDNDDELDASIAAVCAREGFSGAWKLDLSTDRYIEEQNPQSLWFGTVKYFWPG